MLLDYVFIGMAVILFATMFILGEILVKTRGILGAIGLLLMLLYFSYHVSGGALVWMVAIYIIGIALILIDGKLLNDGTLAIIGTLMMIVAIAVPSPSLTYGVAVTIGMMIGVAGALFLLKVFPKRNVWSKLALKDRLTSEAGYNSINLSYKELVGKEGMTMTDFRPIGTVRINETDYSAVSSGQWIKQQTTVNVVAVDGTKIVVKPQTEESIIQE
ncbi:NfeD family protein [Aureibacillus halotolerans]|uniref:NfeD-like partner-binding protein n=1 Tax=Aureibacillus halotolerans TaxID=1508390 RepID=A0A4R6UA25_9BACI|nr:NfeD family protein [Aureibacillus halotolerans]TDQ41709.1 NfeD-like partner-binding protein [Aureibacillus halotolerans]